MSDLPEGFVDTIREAVNKFPASVEDATNQAFDEVLGAPYYGTLRDHLIRKAIQEMIYAYRSKINKEVRKEAGLYGPSPKVVIGKVERVQAAHASMYRYYLGGTVVARLSGLELDRVAESEKNVAQGHLFNSKLCVALREKVNDEQTVAQAMSDKTFKKIFEQIAQQESAG